MGYAQPVTVKMTDIECGGCGIVFAVPEKWRAEKQRTGDGFYCPNGCNRIYKESDVEKANKALKAERARHATTLARLNEAKSALTKSKKRASAGVCPCCDRTFQQLARHMKCKHPEYAA